MTRSTPPERGLAPSPPSRLARWIPALGWLRGYRIGWLRADVVAGITLVAYLIPAGIGDASLAGLPPEAGLYACLFASLVFWLFASSRHTAITVTASLSLLVGSSLAPLAGGDPARFYALASGLALLTAALALIAGLLRAGVIVNFISETVMLGFKAGLALYLASTQLPKLLGFHGSHGDFWENSGHIFSSLHETNPTSLAVGATALAVLVLGKVFLPNRPVGLVVVIGGIAAAGVLDLGARGVKLLGEVPQGLPAIGVPALQWSDLNELLPLAMAVFLLAAVETAAIGRMFGAKHGHRLDSNQEFIALAAANLAAGLGRGFPVSGGMSQSVVNESSGAKTPLSGLVAGLLTLLVVQFLSGSLRALPQPVLAAIVLFAVTSLFKVAALKELWHTSRAEFLVAIGALVGVLGQGVLRGVLIGAIISLVQLLRLASRPHVAVLGRIPGTRRYSDRARHDDNEPTPGALICRPESGIVYFNADRVHDAILEEVRRTPELPELVVCDLSAAPRVDMAGARMLAELNDEIVALGCKLQIVEARSSVRDALRLHRVEDKTGRIDRFTSVADAIEAFEAERAARRPRAE